MHLDNQPVGAHRHRRPRQRQHLVPLARPVAGIHQDRQMALPLHRRHNAQVESIARVIRERPHSALAQDHLVVPLAHDVFGRHQKFFQRRRQPALQQHRLPLASRFLQQGKILHVPGANLNHVRVLGHQLQRLMVDRLRHDPQPEPLPDLRHDLQRFFTQPLERIRRSPRLVRAAPEELRPGSRHLLGNCERLFA